MDFGSGFVEWSDGYNSEKAVSFKGQNTFYFLSFSFLQS